MGCGSSTKAKGEVVEPGKAPERAPEPTGLQARVPTDLQARYTAEVELGQGAFGQVLRVAEMRNGKAMRHVALKIIIPRAGSKLEEVERRFNREVGILAKVESPYVVGLIDWGVSKDPQTCFWLLMPLLNGNSLDKVLESEGMMLEAAVVEVGIAMCNALEAIHALQIIHRDIKPSNILRTVGKLNPGGYDYILIDLGIAVGFAGETGGSVRDISESLVSLDTGGAVKFAGTPPYMSPEQFVGRSGTVAVASDIWSLGVSLFQLITNKLPFVLPPGAGPGYWSHVICNPNQPSPSVLDAGGAASVSAPFADVVAKALRKKSADRFKNAGVMRAALLHAQVQTGRTFYHLMLSYRVRTEIDITESLYKKTQNSITPAGNRCAVYLDRQCLLDGKDWRQGFSEGLMSSLVFIPVISEGFLAPLAGIDVQPSAPNVGKPRLVGSDADQQDNVLYEQLLALALVDKKTDRLPGDKCVMQEIFPILAGQRLEDGTLSNFFADGNNATESGGGKYPTTGSPATTEGVSKFLAENSVQADVQLSVQETVSRLLNLQSVLLHNQKLTPAQAQLVLQYKDAVLNARNDLEELRSAEPVDPEAVLEAEKRVEGVVKILKAKSLDAIVDGIIPRIHEVVDRAVEQHEESLKGVERAACVRIVERLLADDLEEFSARLLEKPIPSDELDAHVSEFAHELEDKFRAAATPVARTGIVDDVAAELQQRLQSEKVNLVKHNKARFEEAQQMAEVDVVERRREGPQFADLFDAARQGNLAAVRYWLMDEKVDVSARNSKGEQAIHVASRCGHGEVLGCLLHQGATCSAEDSQGRTPLHLAALHNHAQACFVMLKDSSAKKGMRDKDGRSAYDIAAALRHTEVATMLHSAVGRLTKDAAREFKDAVERFKSEFGDEAAAGLTQENLTELEAKEEELRLSEEQAFEEARFEDAERYSQQKTLTHSELEDMRKTWGEQKRDREDAGHEFSQLLAQGEGIASMLTRSLEDKKRALNKQANRNYAALKRTKGQLDMVTGELERLRPLGNVLRADATHETHECSPDDLVEWFANRREAAVSKRLQGLRAGPASVAEELEEVLSKEAKSAAEALRATAGEWFCASTLETHKDQIDEELRRVSALVMHALESLKADNLSKVAAVDARFYQAISALEHSIDAQAQEGAFHVLHQVLSGAEKGFVSDTAALGSKGLLQTYLDKFRLQGAEIIAVRQRAEVQNRMQKALQATSETLSNFPCQPAQHLDTEFNRARDAGVKALVEDLQSLGQLSEGLVQSEANAFQKTIEQQRARVMARNAEHLEQLDANTNALVNIFKTRIESWPQSDPSSMAQDLALELEGFIQKVRALTSIESTIFDISRRLSDLLAQVLDAKSKAWVELSTDKSVRDFQSRADALPVSVPSEFEAAFDQLHRGVCSELEASLSANSIGFASISHALEQASNEMRQCKSAALEANTEKIKGVDGQLKSFEGLFLSRLDMLPPSDPRADQVTTDFEKEQIMSKVEKAVSIQDKCLQTRRNLDAKQGAFLATRQEEWAKKRSSEAKRELAETLDKFPATADADFEAAVHEQLREAVLALEEELTEAGVAVAAANEVIASFSTAIKAQVPAHVAANKAKLLKTDAELAQLAETFRAELASLASMGPREGREAAAGVQERMMRRAKGVVSIEKQVASFRAVLDTLLEAYFLESTRVWVGQLVTSSAAHFEEASKLLPCAPPLDYQSTLDARVEVARDALKKRVGELGEVDQTREKCLAVCKDAEVDCHVALKFKVAGLAASNKTRFDAISALLAATDVAGLTEALTVHVELPWVQVRGLAALRGCTFSDASATRKMVERCVEALEGHLDNASVQQEAIATFVQASKAIAESATELEDSDLSDLKTRLCAAVDKATKRHPGVEEITQTGKELLQMLQNTASGFQVPDPAEAKRRKFKAAVEDGRASFVAPSGPKLLLSDSEGISEGKIKWRFRVEGNDSWGIGMVPFSEIEEEDYLFARGKVGLNSEGTAGGQMTKMKMHEKWIEATLDMSKKELRVDIEGGGQSIQTIATEEAVCLALSCFSGCKVTFEGGSEATLEAVDGMSDASSSSEEEDEEEEEEEDEDEDEDSRLIVGCKVRVTEDYKQHGEAKDGPLAPGDVGKLVQDDRSSMPYLVETQKMKTFWYRSKAVEAVPVEKVDVGARVLRGPNWTSGEQDGGRGCVGVILGKGGDKNVKVKWASGETHEHMYEDLLELCYASEKGSPGAHRKCGAGHSLSAESAGRKDCSCDVCGQTCGRSHARKVALICKECDFDMCEDCEKASRFAEGDTVRVKASVVDARYGWGNRSAGDEEEGQIVRFDGDVSYVRFGDADEWGAASCELEKTEDVVASRKLSPQCGGRFYCGKTCGKKGYAGGRHRRCDDACGCDGRCGPGNGCQCPSCYSYQFSTQTAGPKGGGGGAAEGSITVGSKVKLAPGETNEGCLNLPGDVGTVIANDGSDVPYNVRGPRGDTGWFSAAGRLVLVSEDDQDRPPVGGLVCLTPGYERVGDAAGGPLKPGQTGKLVEDDGSAKPFKVKVGAQEWWYQAEALMAVSSSEAGDSDASESSDSDDDDDDAKIDKLKRYLVDHPDSAEVVQPCCQALAALASTEENRVAVAAEGGIELVVKVMAANGSSAGVQEEGCGLLGKLASGAENRVLMAVKGGIDAVLNAMGAHGSSAVVQEKGCEALKFLSLNAENRTLVVAKGGIALVVKAMGANGSSAEVQAQGCEALGNLALSKEIRVLVAAKGGIDAVVNAMGAHRSSVEVQEAGCEALKFLALHAENRVTMAPKGIGVVVNAMGAHGSSEGVQRQGCEALGNLSLNEEIRLAVAAKGGIDVVMNALAAHGSSVEVQTQGCEALGNISFNQENRVLVATKGGIDALLKAMGAHGSSVQVQEKGCEALRNLAFDAANRAPVAAKGGIEAVVKAIGAHESSEGVQRQGCGALYWISRLDSELRTQVRKAGAVALVEKALAAFPDNEALQKDGKGLLTNLGS